MSPTGFLGRLFGSQRPPRSAGSMPEVDGTGHRAACRAVAPGRQLARAAGPAPCSARRITRAVGERSALLAGP